MMYFIEKLANHLGLRITQKKTAGARLYRIAFHATAMMVDHNYTFHLAGIIRDLTEPIERH